MGDGMKSPATKRAPAQDRARRQFLDPDRRGSYIKPNRRGSIDAIGLTEQAMFRRKCIESSKKLLKLIAADLKKIEQERVNAEKHRSILERLRSKAVTSSATGEVAA